MKKNAKNTRNNIMNIIIQLILLYSFLIVKTNGYCQEAMYSKLLYNNNTNIMKTLENIIPNRDLDKYVAPNYLLNYPRAQKKFGGLWLNTNFIYYVFPQNTNGNLQKIYSSLEFVFGKFTEFFSFSFIRANNRERANIHISFVNQKHNSTKESNTCQIFNDRTIAHAFYPEMGMLHFNIENYKYRFIQKDNEKNSNGFVDFNTVFIHEFLHALGLNHYLDDKDKEGNLIKRFYNDKIMNIDLGPYEVSSLANAYPNKLKLKRSAVYNVNNINHIHNHGIDRSFNYLEKKIEQIEKKIDFVSKELNIISKQINRDGPEELLKKLQKKIKNNSIIPIVSFISNKNVMTVFYQDSTYVSFDFFTKKLLEMGIIQEKWLDMPSPMYINTVLYDEKNDDLYVFSRYNYYKFRHNILSKNYPIDIKKGFPGIPYNIFGALLSDEHILFIKNELTYKFEFNKNPPVNCSNPYRNNYNIFDRVVFHMFDKIYYKFDYISIFNTNTGLETNINNEYIFQ